MEIPFFPNTPDGTHCFQAALASVFAHVWPGRTFTFGELDRISAKVPGKWTWPTAAMLWMIEEGLDILLIEDFDYEDFAARGEMYLVERLGGEVAAAQIENSVIDQELEFARQFAKIAPLECRLPNFGDMHALLKEGYLIICNINAAALYGHPGYSGHFVVVLSCGRDSLTIHDPGLPPKPSLKVDKKAFERAWAYPTEREKNLLAVRLKKKD
jgi:hypothetical protein